MPMQRVTTLVSGRSTWYSSVARRADSSSAEGEQTSAAPMHASPRPRPGRTAHEADSPGRLRLNPLAGMENSLPETLPK